MATFRLRGAHVAGLRRERFAAGLQTRLQAEGKTTSYDPASSVVQSTDAAGRTFAYRLGDDGFIDAVKSPAGRVSYLRSDADGNLLEFVEPSGQASQFAYEKGVPTSFGRNGQPLCRFEVDAERTRNDATFWDGSRASATFDVRNRPLSLTNRLGATERFSYDSLGRLSAFVDANGARTRFFYGASAKLARTLYPDGHSDFATYDAAGNVATLRASGQRSIRVKSNPSGRPTEIAYPDGTSSTFAYDARGRVSAAEHAAATSSYRYGDAGELLEETNGAHSFKFDYDPTGLLLSIEYPDQSRVVFEYDVDKRLARITDWSGAGTSFRRALDDRSEAKSLPNGLETAVALTPAGQPERTVTRNPRSGAVLYETQAAFDVQGRIVSLADSELGKRIYSYDAESQVLAVHSGTGEALEWFSYDPAGNRTSNNGNRVELGPGNRVLSASNARCGYDRHGNLTEAEWSGKAWRYRYDARDQLVEAEGPTDKIRFEYDAFGRRALKQSDASKTEYVWCGEHLTREIITTGEKQETRDYLYLPGTHTPFALRVDGHVYYYHCDHRGTPQRLTDASGRVVWAAEYSAFGRARVHVALVENSLRFPGQYYDSETGLHYNRFRYYSAELGRYITPDPIGLLGGSNGYRYVGNDPLNKTDPLGLWWKAALAVVAGVAVAAAIIITAPVSLPLIAGAAVLGVAVGVGVDKALNIDHFCVSCFASAFASGFVSGAEIAVGFVVAAALFPEAAAVLAVGGAVVGCYGILAEHLGWPMPAGELLSPSTWHLHSGKSFDEMSDEEKSASLGNLAGGTAGAIAGGALAGGLVEEPGVPPEDGPIGEEPIGEEPVGKPAPEDEPVGEERPTKGDEEGPPTDEDEEPANEDEESDEAPKTKVDRVERTATDPEISPTTGQPVEGASKVVEYQDAEGNTLSRYYVDDQGRTVQAEGKLDPPADYTKEGVRNIDPDGLQKGIDHRGHLVPERGAPDADAVNVPENVVAEHGTKSNLSAKRAWENRAIDYAEDDPGSTSVHQPNYDGDNPRPTSIDHSLYDSDGNLVPGMSKNIPQPNELRCCLTHLKKKGLESLSDLTHALTAALEASATQHLTAVSVSSHDDDGSGAVTGGGLTAPSPPPFVYPHNALVTKHRALLGHRLYAVVARAERPNVGTPWHVRVQLVSRDERRDLESKRRPLDQAIESELRRFGQGPKWKRSSFGRVSSARPPLVTIADPSSRKLPPSPRLIELLTDVVTLYANVGLTLVTATWTLRPNGLDVWTTSNERFASRPVPARSGDPSGGSSIHSERVGESDTRDHQRRHGGRRHADDRAHRSPRTTGHCARQR